MQLKYGCNPHQSFASIEPIEAGTAPLELLNGNPSYINLLDALNAWQLVAEVRQATGLAAATSFKHVSPAGAAVACELDPALAEAYEVLHAAQEVGATAGTVGTPCEDVDRRTRAVIDDAGFEVHYLESGITQLPSFALAGPPPQIRATLTDNGDTLEYAAPGLAAVVHKSPLRIVFARDGDAVFHTYSTFARGLDPCNATYQLLDIVPKGRDEAGLTYPQEWLKRRDEY